MQRVAVYLIALRDAIAELREHGYDNDEIRAALDLLNNAVFLGFTPDVCDLMLAVKKEEHA